MAAQDDLARKHGLARDEDKARATVGQAMPVTESILQHHGVRLTVEQIITELVERVVKQVDNGIPWLPGAERILSELAAARIPSVLVTMAFSSVATHVAASAPIGTFHAFAAGDDVSHGKPHPAPYLAAADLLGVDPPDAWPSKTPSTAPPARAGSRHARRRGAWSRPAATWPGRHFVSSLQTITESLRGIINARAP